MALFEPPPTHSDPFIKQAGKEVFNPIWLRWFLKLVDLINQAGGSLGILHNSLGGLQGGTAGEYYHLTSARYSTITGTQPVNYVFAGPSSGGSAIADFRPLVAADIPGSDMNLVLSGRAFTGVVQRDTQSLLAGNNSLNAPTISGAAAVSGTWVNGTGFTSQYATFDPAAKNAHITLTGSDLIATNDGTAVHAAVLGTLSKSSGKYYAEFTITGVTCNEGIGTSSTSLADGAYLGSDNNAYGLNKTTSNIYHNGSPIVYGNGVVIADGSVVSMLLDLDNNTLAFWDDGVLIAPAISITAGTYFPAASAFTSASVTANFGATAFAYTPPAGYVSWFSTVPVTLTWTIPAVTLGGTVTGGGQTVDNVVLTGSTYNGLTLTALATGFTISGGTTSKTLTVPLDASVSGTNTGDDTFTPAHQVFERKDFSSALYSPDAQSIIASQIFGA